MNQNIQWLYSSINALSHTEEDTLDLIKFYADILKNNKSKKINELTRSIDQEYHFESGHSLREIRSLLAHRYFTFDLNISFKELKTDHIQLGEVNLWKEVLHAENQ